MLALRNFQRTLSLSNFVSTLLVCALFPIQGFSASDDGLDKIIEVGTRNLQWIQILNEGREEPLSFSSPETAKGYPIWADHYYNPQTIQDDFKKATEAMSAEYKSILFGSEPLPKRLPGSENEFLRWGREIDSIYSSAVRWRDLATDLPAWAENRKYDLRGYYYLNQDKKITSKLRNWSTQSKTIQQKLQGWLVGICLNTHFDKPACQEELKTAIEQGQTVAFYDKYMPGARALWESGFTVNYPRKNLDWTQTEPNIIRFNFEDPGSSEVREFLKSSIEDVWRSGNMRIVVNFVPPGAGGARVRFEPGSFTYVPQIGGDEIVMDGNAPFTEYITKHVMAHEFGHLLGFEDCYIQFYEEENQRMVSYQLDLTDIMCSGQGHVKPSHFEELKKVYFNPSN